MAHDQRREGRVPVAGTLRLLVKGGAGFLLVSGEIADLSAGGCAVRVGHSEIQTDLKGRIEVSIGGQSISLPVVTRWIRADGDGCIVGCRFLELNMTELRAIQALMIETCAIADSSPGRLQHG